MKILIASPISPDAISALEAVHDVVCAFGATEATLRSLIADREALIFRSGVQITAAVMENAPHLRLIVRAGSGYENIDLDHVRRRRIRFIRIPGPGARAVAEMSFCLMLALARKLRWADGEWRRGNWVKSAANGHLLSGKTLGIVGAGNIGSRAGKLGAAWGMNVIGCVEHPTAEQRARLGNDGIELGGLAEVLAASDFVSVHVPLQASTRNLIDTGALALMKPGAFLVNLSRGGVVDERALYDALASGRLAGAGLDVHENEGHGHISPLAALDNVLLTPHIGASTVDSQREIGRIILSALEEAVAEPVRENEPVAVY
jgi:phosphoglycerate dehydrogenase-like enzyme